MSRRLGRYELLEQLGEGGMGAVWLARLTGAAGFEKLCIVKTVLPSIAKDAEFVSRFLHEGRVLTQLSHGNIAQVLDLNEADGTLFLALEYVSGVDLSRLQDQVRALGESMPVDVAVALIAQAAEGLGAAHRKAALDGSALNIVHRDVSPHNVMVSYEGEVKVIDFGIAKSEARSRHTAQASVLGKLGYMAPEQASGEPVDHRADQYALGIIAWELLSNQPFVRRGTLTEMLAAMANPKVQPLAPLRADVPPSLEAVVLKALSAKPDDRFATTDAFAQALMREQLVLGAPPTKPGIGQYVRSRCAQEFATTRELLTRVSTQRSPPPEGARATVDLYAETTVRAVSTPKADTQVLAPLADTQALAPLRAPLAEPSGASSPGDPAGLDTARTERGPEAPAITPLDRPATTRAPAPAPQPRPLSEPPLTEPLQPRPVSEPPLTTGEFEAATRSKRPLLLVGVGLLAAVLAGAVLLTTRREDAAPPTAGAVADAGTLVAAAPPAPRPAPERVVAERLAAEPVAPEPIPAEPVAAPAPEATLDAGLEVVAPFPPEEPPTLSLVVRGGGRAWVLTNANQRNWTRCRLTAPGQRMVDLGTMPRGMSQEVSLSRLKFNAGARALEAQVRVDCDQGYGLAQAP